MRMRHPAPVSRILAAIALAGLAIGGTACVATASGRIYDPVYGDYHYWNNDEESSFQVYLTENNLPHREFRSMSRNDQNAYWKWRHNRPSKPEPKPEPNTH
jgi:hypothetical protein